MVVMGQGPAEGFWEKILDLLRFVLKIPIIVLAIVAAAMFSWLAFWFIVRLTTYAFHTWLSERWY